MKRTTLKLMGMNSTIAIYATNGNRTPVVPMRELMEKCIAVRALVLFALPMVLQVAGSLGPMPQNSMSQTFWNGGPSGPGQDPTLPHIALAVSDIVESRKELERMGVKYWAIEGLTPLLPHLKSGGLRALAFYHRKSAIQAPASVLELLGKQSTALTL
mgnify:CR=1 FL=1